MRHRKHNHQLGVKSAHRTSLLANLCCSLIESGRIKTTLAKARAVRPTIEKLVTLAKKANLATEASQKIHYRRLAIARLRSKKAVKKLFDELVDQFIDRKGGYTRIYKLAIPRLGDAAEMALIEFVEEKTSKPSKRKTTKSKKKELETKTDSPTQVSENPEVSENEKIMDFPQDESSSAADEAEEVNEVNVVEPQEAKSVDSKQEIAPEVVNTDPTSEGVDDNVESTGSQDKR